MWSATEIENFLHSSQETEPTQKPLSAEVIADCLQLFDVDDPKLLRAIQFSLQRQAANHLMARTLLGGRTDISIARNNFHDLVPKVGQLLNALGEINVLLRLPLIEHFEDSQLEHRHVITLVEFEEKLKLLRNAALVAVPQHFKGGNRSDPCLEVAVGALMFFMMNIIKPARTGRIGEDGRKPHFTQKRQTRIICSFLAGTEPNQAFRISQTYVEYLMKKIRKRHGRDNLAAFAPVLLSGFNVAVSGKR